MRWLYKKSEFKTQGSISFCYVLSKFFEVCSALFAFCTTFSFRLFTCMSTWFLSFLYFLIPATSNFLNCQTGLTHLSNNDKKVSFLSVKFYLSGLSVIVHNFPWFCLPVWFLVMNFGHCYSQYLAWNVNKQCGFEKQLCNMSQFAKIS